MRIPCAAVGGLGGVLGVDHELADAGLVAEVDEDEPAVVAPPRDPAGERRALPGLVGPEPRRSSGRARRHEAESVAASSSRVTASSSARRRRRMRRAVRRATITMAARAEPAGLRELALAASGPA